MGWFDRLRAGAKRPPPAESSLEEHFAAFVAAIDGARWREPLTQLPAAMPLLTVPAADLGRLIDLCLDWLGQPGRPGPARTLVGRMASHLLTRRSPLSADDLSAVIDRCGAETEEVINAVVAAAEGPLEQQASRQRIHERLSDLRDRLQSQWPDAAGREVCQRLDRILAHYAALDPLSARVDSWTIALAAETDPLGEQAKLRWRELLAHCGGARASKPSKRWLAAAAALVEQIGREDYLAAVRAIIAATCTPAPFEITLPSAGYGLPSAKGDPTRVSPQFDDHLRGVIWTCAVLEEPALWPALGSLAERAFHKLRDHGPTAPKIGNACLCVLGRAGTPEAVAQLSRLKLRVRHASSRRQVERALEEAAKLSGTSTADLEELAAPSCGLTAVGTLSLAAGDYTGELNVVDSRSVVIVWRKPDGRTQKSVPAPVKVENPGTAETLKRVTREVKQHLPAQRDRLERMLLSQRSLPLPLWRERYWTHPLVGALAQRAIWSITEGHEETLVCGQEGRLVDLSDSEVSLSDAATVRLWHPIHSPPDTVLQWRRWLEEREITQPFKQAHREIYLLTDAERRTANYSNRFAAHVLRQHQFHQLLRQRGWRYALQGGWDSHNTPHIELPEQDYRVEYWVDAGEAQDREMTDAGILLCIGTDQVRFYRRGAEDPEALESIPALVFSEMMRDVDLFVSVCSVGNDPGWRDGGADGRHATYWNGYAFGELGEMARTRRDVLSRVLPKLRIADRCRLAERTLVVEGRLASYAIHLGSGNVKILPNNVHLCIVVEQTVGKSRPRLMLPFEGDPLLSVVLSKAFLLAEDHKIKDRVVINQIRRSAPSGAQRGE